MWCFHGSGTTGNYPYLNTPSLHDALPIFCWKLPPTPTFRRGRAAGYPAAMAIPPNSHLKVPARGDLPGIDRANAAALLSRGLTRFFAAHGLVSLPEFTLRSGRRADLLCFDAKCRITPVEIKSKIGRAH